MSDEEKPVEKKPPERPKETPPAQREAPGPEIRPGRPGNRETFETEIIKTPGRSPDERLTM